MRLALLLATFSLGCSQLSADLDPEPLDGGPSPSDGGGDGGPMDAGAPDSGEAPLEVVPPGPEVEIGAIPEAECVDGRWCWVAGLPHTVQAADGRLFALAPGGRVLERYASTWRSWPGLSDGVEGWVIATAADGSMALLDGNGTTHVWTGSAWAEGDRDHRWLFRGPDGRLWAHRNDARYEHWLEGRWQDADIVSPTPSCLQDHSLSFEGELYVVVTRCEGDLRAVEVHRHRDGAWQKVGDSLPFEAAYSRLHRFGGELHVQNGYGSRTFVLKPWDGWEPSTLPALDRRRLGDLGCGSQAWHEGKLYCAVGGRIAIETADGWLETLDPNPVAPAGLQTWGTYPRPFHLEPGDRDIIRVGVGAFIRVGSEGEVEQLNLEGWSSTGQTGVNRLIGFDEDVWLIRGDGAERWGSSEVVELEGYAPMAALGGGALAYAEQSRLERTGPASSSQAFLDQIAYLSAFGPDDIWVFLGGGRLGVTAAQRWDGSTWSEVEDFGSGGSVARDPSGRLWTVDGPRVRCLNAECPPLPPLPTGGRFSLFITEDTVWVFDGSDVALRYR